MSTPDVFLSYSREDQAIARRFAEALEREGFVVWWDQSLHPGETFDKVTEQALRDAKAVVVLWSPRSVESRWVRSEATQADRHGTLVPVTIEACERPILFELSHTADLSTWKGDRNDPAWRGFIASIRRHTDAPGTAPAPVTSILPAPAMAAQSRGMLAIVAAGVALLLAVGGYFWAMGREGRVPAASPGAPATAPALGADSTGTATVTAPGIAVTSVAVLPFSNLTGEADKDFFGDGMAEELINALAQVDGLQVASRTSSFAYKGRNTDLRQIGRELGVATVIEGSVRSAGDRIRLTAQLINAESGYHLWSETYDRDFRDLFKLQDEITREIVVAYRRTMGVDQLGFRPQRPPTANLDAYVFYLRAMYALAQSTDVASLEALGHAERAIALDPNFARAYWAAAVALSLLPTRSLDEVERYAQRATELDETVGRSLLGSIAARRGDWVKAEQIFRTVASGDSDNLRATSTQWPAGRLRDALRTVHALEATAPTASTFASSLARLYASVGDLEKAQYWYEATIERGSDPAGRRARQVLYEIALQRGQLEAAADIAVEFLTPDLRTPQGEAAVRLAHRAVGDSALRKPAVDALQTLLARAGPDDWIVKVFALGWYSQIGAIDEAYALAESLREQFAGGSQLGAWSWLWFPQMSAFRSDARFQPFTTRVGLMRYWEMYGPPDVCTLEAGKLTCT